MKKLKRVRLINWHNLVNEVIEINGNTILTGPNASGKSTILDAITFVLTAGDVSFNIAANEKSKRDLKGYIKCKLGIDDKEYQRPGDVSGHIALEFYDERAEKYFTVGAACDAFGETTPVKTLFYKNEAQFEDSWFLDDRKKVYGTVEFRKHNPSFEYYLTKKEAKRGFRNAFGSINEDFYKLIPKALAFKPIADVKDFIYENILEEKQIDVSAIQDSIRAYKELEVTLKQIQAKIADLREIDVLYQEIVKIRENKAYLEYLMHLFNVEAIKKQIKDFKKKIDTENEYKASKNLELKDLENENLQLNERSKELYKMLDSNEAFKMDEYLNREINRIQTDNKSLEENQAAFLRRAASFKDILADLKRLSNEKIYNEGTNINLSLINQQSVLDAKLRLNDFSARINEVKDKKNQELGQIQSKINEIVLSINKIQNAVNNANQNKRNYNPQILQIKEELQENLKLLYNYDISVHILCELCEITDPKWADTVEVFLGNRRFMLVVEPRYYDQALNIYARIVNKYRLYGIGLINTKKIQNF